MRVACARRLQDGVHRALGVVEPQRELVEVVVGLASSAGPGRRTPGGRRAASSRTSSSGSAFCQHISARLATKRRRSQEKWPR